MKIKTKEELNEAIFENFSISEISNINPKIYFNNEYICYWMAYKCGDYQFCYDFLLKNRDLLQ